MLNPWPCQIRAWNGIDAAIAAGKKGILVSIPTGGGKTFTFIHKAREWAAQGQRVGIFVDRRLLLDQASDQLGGTWHGIIAAGHREESVHRIQVISLQTLTSRDIVPDFDKYIFDEAHSMVGGMAQAVMAKAKEKGAVRLGVSATPVGLSGYYDVLIEGGTNSELRKCGALVPCHVYAPDEPDMTGVKTINGEYNTASMRKRWRQVTVFGNVFAHWERINPLHESTIVFAPGVEESIWLRDEFRKRGVSCEHIDGSTPDKQRDDIISGSKEGAVDVITSAGVLGQGANFPWVVVGILLQPCAGVSTYLQRVGRILRKHPGKDAATLIDHAGCWHRHGSPNEDRKWTLDCTDKELAVARKREVQSGVKSEGINCSRCRALRKGGLVCPFCGHESVRSVREILMSDGTLKRQVGQVVKKQKDEQIFNSCLFAAGRSGQTFSQAVARYIKKTGKRAPEHLCPPIEEWGLRVSDIPMFRYTAGG